MAPWSMKPLAIILPMPREPPVTSAVRPLSENMSSIMARFPLIVAAKRRFIRLKSPRIFDLEGSSAACNKRLNFGAATPDE